MYLFKYPASKGRWRIDVIQGFKLFTKLVVDAQLAADTEAAYVTVSKITYVFLQ